MKQKSVSGKAPAEKVLKDIRRQTTQALFGRGKDPYRAGGVAGRGEHLRAVPPRGHRRLDVLRLVQGVPGGRQTPAGRRHGAFCDLRRGKGSPPRGRGVEGGRC
jgi:hypothetical protein